MSERIAFIGKEVDVMLGFRGELMAELRNKGHEIYAFSIDYDEKKIETVRNLGYIPVKYKLNGYSLNPLSELTTIYRLWRLLKQHKITMSFCYFAKPVVYGTLAAYWAKVPRRIAKIEGLGRTFTKGKEKASLKMRLARMVQSFLFKVALPKAEALIVLNRDDEQDLRAICGKKMPTTVVLGGIGVCLDRFKHSPVPLDPISFIFVGRLLDEKGIRYFIEAAQRIKQRYPNVEFKVLGAPVEKCGVTQKELLQYVEEGTIIYPGKVDDVVPYIEQSSVFVLPSYYREGVPRSTQEALAIGRPVITTDSPGCRETVIDGENGFLIEPHNVEQLVEAMEKLISDRALMTSMGPRSRQFAESKFDVIRINKELIDLLNL